MSGEMGVTENTGQRKKCWGEKTQEDKNRKRKKKTSKRIRMRETLNLEKLKDRYPKNTEERSTKPGERKKGQGNVEMEKKNMQKKQLGAR